MAQRNQKIYRFKITLQGIEPPIWRRIEVPGAMTLAALHEVIQNVMPWSDSHLHQFEIAGEKYGLPEPGFDYDQIDTRRKTLSSVLGDRHDHFQYLYDFGDDWVHDIQVEAVVKSEPGVACRCLGGERAAPPDDCGGTWGYAEVLEVIADPKHPEYESMREWLDESWSPEHFSLEECNEILKKFR